jgi:transposase
LYGYSQKGERCYGTFSYNKRGRIHVIGALENNRLVSVMMVKGNVNSDVFYAYIKEILLENIKPNTIVVLDNATFHKRKDIQELIKSNNHTLLYLPVYSPDLNPIEHKWAHMKSVRKNFNFTPEETVSYFIRA